MRVECSYMFLIVVLEKMSESPLDSKEIKSSFRLILKEINPEYSLEVLMLNWSSNTLATWCKESTHWKRPWFWERLKAKGEKEKVETEEEMAR